MNRFDFSKSYGARSVQSADSGGGGLGRTIGLPPPSRFEHSFQRTRLENLSATPIPVLSRVDNPFMSSCVILGGRNDSAMDSQIFMKSRTHNGRLRLPFPALSRQHVVKLFSRDHVGLLFSTLFAGILTNCVKRGVLPLMENELQLETYQAEAASVLIQLPWSYSFIWGFISDAVPILGSRRKAYVILAWMMAMLSCFAIVLMDQMIEIKAANLDVTTVAILKHDKSLVNAYIFFLILINFGCMLAIFVGETYVIAQTRRERLSVRGTALGTILLAQFSGEFIAQLVSDYSIFHITELGLTPLVTLRQVMLFFVFYSVAPLLGLSLCFFENDDPPAIDIERDRNDRVSIFPRETETSAELLERAYQTAGTWFQRLKLALKGHWIRLKSVLGRESTKRVFCFLVGFIFISEFTLTYPTTRLAQWCGMTLKAQSASNIMLKAFSIMPIALWKFAVLNVDWRWSIFASLVVFTMVPQLIYYMAATLDPAARSINAFAVISALIGFRRTAVVVLELAMTTEIAPVGGEGAFVGIVVSVASSMRLLSTTVSNLLGSMFKDVKGSASFADPDRMQVAFALVLSHSLQVIALVALVFLPKQKRELQRLHRFGKHGDTRMAWWILGSLGVAFLLSVVINALAISPSTSCLSIVGGSGCA